MHQYALPVPNATPHPTLTQGALPQHVFLTWFQVREQRMVPSPNVFTANKHKKNLPVPSSEHTNTH